MAARSWVLIAVVVVGGCREAPPAATAPPAAEAPPTYTTDVAPILAANCATCHRPDQGAPFNLLTFEDARTNASDIARVVETRRMPPWLPAPGHLAFIGERRLSDADIKTLRRWADGGAPEGPATSALRPPPPTGWQFGQPDLELRPARAYVLRPGDGDVFRNLLIRTKIPADRHVRAVEFRPGSAPVHHAVVHLDSTDGSRRKDGADGQAGFEGMGGEGTQEPAGHFVGWAPGRGPIVSAEGMPWKLAAGTDLVVELHLIPQKAPVSVQPWIALYFADGPPPAASPLVVKMGARVIDIPPGATDYVVTDQYVLPVDVRVLSLYPHAHYLGKEIAVQAMLPDGSTRTLLQIPRWSFHWQQDYRFVQPVALPRGTTLAMRFTYDNSTGNPDNPHHPPVRVVMGQRSTDEMGNLLLQVVTGSSADGRALQQDIALRDAARALESDGASWQAQNDMGAALLSVKRPAEAVTHFDQAVRLKPGDALLHFNLAKALLAAGSPEPAGAALRRALALNPRLAEAHNELGVMLFAAGRLPDALVHLREAVRLAPNSAIAHSDLGGALAQAGRRDEALVHLRRALALDPGNAAAAENLARLRGGR